MSVIRFGASQRGSHFAVISVNKHQRTRERKRERTRDEHDLGTGRQLGCANGRIRFSPNRRRGRKLRATIARQVQLGTLPFVHRAIKSHRIKHHVQFQTGWCKSSKMVYPAGLYL